MNNKKMNSNSRVRKENNREMNKWKRMKCKDRNRSYRKMRNSWNKATSKLERNRVINMVRNKANQEIKNSSSSKARCKSKIRASNKRAMSNHKTKRQSISV